MFFAFHFRVKVSKRLIVAKYTKISHVSTKLSNHLYLKHLQDSPTPQAPFFGVKTVGFMVRPRQT